MKHTLRTVIIKCSFALLLLQANNLLAQTDSIHFYSRDVENVLTIAKQEHKLVFIDCYTKWCVPCKAMDKLVFVNDSVANYFNRHFINLHLDMETDEGRMVLKKYKVGAFPTFLFLDDNANLIYKFVGYQPDSIFLKMVKKGVAANAAQATLVRQYNAGDRSPEVIRQYIKYHIDVVEIEDAKALTSSYLDTLSLDKATDTANWFLFSNSKYGNILTGINSKNMDFLLAHWQSFAEKLGNKIVNDKIQHIFFDIASTSLNGFYFKKHTYSPSLFQKYKRQIALTETPNKNTLLIMMDMADAAGRQDKAMVGNILADHILEFSERDKRIAFDFWTMCGISPVMVVPRKDEVSQKILASAQDPGLVATAKEYLRKK